MSKPKPPQFVSDLYRDLRDRRLLLPIAALLVAMVAVPILLGAQGGEAAPPPPVAPVAGDEAVAVEPAVLVEEGGIRNYRKRLGEFKSKNPFAQKFALPTPESVALGGDGSGGSEDSTGVADTGGGTSVTDTTSTTETFGTSDTTSTTVTDTADNVEPTDDSASGSPPKPEVRFYAGRIDVAIGELGEVKEIRDVRYLDFLPNDKSPAVTFISLDGAGEAAVFAISRDVVDTSGDGTCAPKRQDGCQFLTLNVGEQRMLRYADGTTYRLKLLETRIVRVPDPRDG